MSFKVALEVDWRNLQTIAVAPSPVHNDALSRCPDCPAGTSSRELLSNTVGMECAA
jgi:hypothetical protein